jgi:hypothetical protein
MVAASAKLPHASTIALWGSGVWAMGLCALAYLPTYESVSETASGGVTRSTATLVSENGNGILIVLALPLAMTLAVSVALRLRAADRGVTAWTLTAGLGLFNLLALASIGILVVPVTAGLVIACAAASRVTSREGLA